MWLQHAHGVSLCTCDVHTPLLYLGNGWTDCAQICYVSRGRYDMWLRHIDWGVSARAQLHTPPLFRVLAWIGWFKVDDCGISRGNFSRHGSCKLLCDTSLALARSSPTRRYIGWHLSVVRSVKVSGDLESEAQMASLESQSARVTSQPWDLPIFADWKLERLRFWEPSSRLLRSGVHLRLSSSQSRARQCLSAATLDRLKMLEKKLGNLF